MPRIGFGTWQLPSLETESIVKCAIDNGYRHFDCAYVYGNEDGVGRAIRQKISEGVVKREDLFVVTKLWNTFHEREMVVPYCKKSLQHFGLDYIDQYLIHWPVAQKYNGKLNIDTPLDNPVCTDYDYVETWKGMEECVKLGLVKGIGLSNFNSKQVERVLNVASITPVVNQIEVNATINQKKMIKFCKERNIVVTAYSPFGSPTRPWAKFDDHVLPLDNENVVAIGKKYNKTAPQVILRYLVDIGTVPLPRSSNEERLISNINIFDFQLTQEDISIIDSFNRNLRAIEAEDLKASPHYPFKDIDF